MGCAKGQEDLDLIFFILFYYIYIILILVRLG